MSTAATESGNVEGEFAAGQDPKRWLALIVIVVAQLLIVLDATVVNIALPTLQKALHISDANRQWALTAYTLAFGGLLLLGGRIADYTGRKRAFIIGLLGFASSSALGGLSVDAYMLFGARALQGAFAALMAPAALSLLTVTFTKAKERATAFGIYGAIAGGGSAVGLLLGGVLTEFASWRWTLLISTPIAIAAAIGSVAWVRESSARGNTRYDIPGVLASTLGLVALVYGLTRAAPASQTSGSQWGSAITITLFAVAAVLLVGFVFIELRVKNPLLPMRVLRERNRAGSYLSALLIGVAIFGTFLLLSFYMQQVLGYSTLKTGVAFLPFTVGIVAGSAISIQLMTRTGPRLPMAGGLLLAAIGQVLLTFIGVHTDFWSHVFPSEVITSVGLGLVFGPLTNTALVGVSDHDAGVASALVNTAQQIGGSIGVALLNTIAITVSSDYLINHAIAPSNQQGMLTATVHGFTLAFWVAAALLAAGAIIAAIFVRVRGDQLSGETPPPA